MLRKLSVQNYALIDDLQMDLGNGLNIITGETGAGKSILMGALGLLLGERSDSSALLDTSKKCIIRGEFISNPNIRSFLNSNDLDSDDDLILHREINKDGKSRAFINDTPVNLSLLRELGMLLVDIHSQHETLLLNKTDFQLSIVDAFANHLPLLNEFTSSFHKYSKLNKELSALIEEENKSRNEQDYLQFQFSELSEAQLNPGELKSLEEELTSLTHAEEIKGSIEKFSHLMSGSDSNLISKLSESINQLSTISKYYSSIDTCINRLKASKIELQDIEDEVQKEGDKIAINPNRLEIVNDRLNVINKLLQKHRLNTVEELILLRDQLDEKLTSFSSLGDKISKIKIEVDKLFQQLKLSADKISFNRKKSVPVIETTIKKLLSELSMPDAIFKVDITEKKDDEINSSGKDQIRFLFSANKGIMHSEISKVASGGELSRLMLSLKASVAKLIEMPTIVFDEIDSGVSGETAFKIGKVMQDLSRFHQLIAITHLPQIASRGEDHYFIYKEVVGKKTFTKLKKLSSNERVVEVARMLSGDKPTAVAMQNAKELLKF